MSKQGLKRSTRHVMDRFGTRNSHQINILPYLMVGRRDRRRLFTVVSIRRQSRSVCYRLYVWKTKGHENKSPHTLEATTYAAIRSSIREATVKSPAIRTF